MKLRGLLARITVGTVVFAGFASSARAGGMLLPGNGAISTSRAGAAVASVSDGEALSLNPAGLAKAKGTTITISMAIIDYAVEFTRAGTYDPIAEEALPYEGTAYPTMKNDPSPPLGLGSFQPVPVVAIVSDLGGAVPNLTLAAGLYVPSAYPFRDMCTELSGGCQKYVFNGDFNVPPPSTRYDIMKQEAAIFVPTLAAAYRVLPELDVGARFGPGYAHVKSTAAVWGVPANVTEYVKQDAVITADAKDGFVPSWGLGVSYRPTPAIELAANYSSQLDVNAKGDATNETGPAVGLNGTPITIGPVEDAAARCARGGTAQAQKACVELALPMSVQLGGRYKFLGADGRMKGDVELDVGWENWSAERATDYRIVVDAQIFVNGNPSLGLKDTILRHGLKDVFTVRAGGSYHIPVSASEVIVRGGIGYDTAAAKDGWLRVDLDGAARTTATIGAGYRTSRWELNVGGGAILEGTNENGTGTCNPVASNMLGCAGDGNERPVDQREGLDPINPIQTAESQLEAPVNHGTYKSHYVLLMLGFSTWF